MFKTAHLFPKELAKRIAREIGWPPLISGFLHHPAVEWRLRNTRIGRGFYVNRAARLHPFDRLHGTDTSGIVAPDDFPPDDDSRHHATLYAGSQPSVIRQALQALPPLDGFIFIDLGCGKGRALLVASEFPFHRILGVELSPQLAETARGNIAIVAKHFPQRIAAEVVVNDASLFPMPPADNLVVFLFHPFQAELMPTVVANVEAALSNQSRSVYVVYCNPVAGRYFDASPALRRRFAKQVRYGAEDLGYGHGEASPVVIWQGGAAPPPLEPADARIAVQPGNLLVLLEDV